MNGHIFFLGKVELELIDVSLDVVILFLVLDLQLFSDLDQKWADNIFVFNNIGCCVLVYRDFLLIHVINLEVLFFDQYRFSGSLLVHKFVDI